MIFPENVTWVSSIDSARYLESYRHAIDTWNLLPGRKILFMEGAAEVIPEVEVIDFWSTVDRSNSNWLQNYTPSKKTQRFWFKGHSLYYSLKKKYSRYIIWIDADVYVKDKIPKELIEINNVPVAMMRFNKSLYADGNLLGEAVESGLQIFDTTHQDIDLITEEYYSYWETGKIFDLYKPYDGWVSTEISKKYSFLNLVNSIHSERFIGENTFLYTNFKEYLIHFLGKANKSNIEKYKRENT